MMVAPIPVWGMSVSHLMTSDIAGATADAAATAATPATVEGAIRVGNPLSVG
jgi:hypothetical protein